jgi:hypothetical protein
LGRQIADDSLLRVSTAGAHPVATDWLDNSHDAEMRKLLRVDLLILDDFALQALDALDTSNAHDLIVGRHRAAATVVTADREPIR